MTGDGPARVVHGIPGGYEISCPRCPGGRWPNDAGTGPAKYPTAKDAARGMVHHNATALHDGSPAGVRLPTPRPSWITDRDLWPCTVCGRKVPAGPHDCTPTDP